MSKIIKGRGKILFHDEKDREKMNKKYPEIEFEKMNSLTFTTKYKGNKQFEVEIQVGDTKISCAFNKWAWPWKYGTKVELRLYFKDLKKKAITHITGGIQHELFRFFRYDYEKMMKDDPKLQKSLKLKAKKSKLTTKQKKKMNAYLIEKYGYSKWAKDEDPELGKEYVRILKNPDKFLKGGCGQRGGKQTRKKSKKDKTLRNKYKKISRIDCAKKYPKSRDKTLKCLDKKVKDLKSLESEFPEEIKTLKKEIKEYETMMNTFVKEASECKKNSDMDKIKKCIQEVTKKYKKILIDDKEMGKLYTDNMRDNLYRMIDHTQKVDLGELGKLNL